MQWLLAFHIIGMVAWFAGLFYLPRLFVYHAVSQDDISIKRFKIMERKLYYVIMTPAAIATIILGALLLSFNFTAYMAASWMQIKLGLVVLLIIFHILCGRFLKNFQNDKNRKNANFYRAFNEIPTLLLISIVILVVVKPF